MTNEEYTSGVNGERLRLAIAQLDAAAPPPDHDGFVEVRRRGLRHIRRLLAKRRAHD